MPLSERPQLGEAKVSMFCQFEGSRNKLAANLRECASGRELRARGRPKDLELATALNSSDRAPRLQIGAFGAAIPG
jgi:phosphosulfolactate phosphohydrolase-like enzyme